MPWWLRSLRCPLGLFGKEVLVDHAGKSQPTSDPPDRYHRCVSLLVALASTTSPTATMPSLLACDKGTLGWLLAFLTGRLGAFPDHP